MPTDIGSSALFSPGLNAAQYGLARPPPPGNAVFIVAPADVRTRTSNPATLTLSPGFGTVCVAPL
jgi:hypothetical protein